MMSVGRHGAHLYGSHIVGSNPTITLSYFSFIATNKSGRGRVSSLSFVKQNGKGFDKGSNFKILESSSYRKEAVTLTFFVL